MEAKDLKIERQKFQMLQKGFDDVSKALASLKEDKPEIDLTETNAILKQLVEKINEPLCVELVLK